MASMGFTASSGARLAAAVAAGYAVGTAPCADLATRLAAGDRDVRTEGTGNPGAMNAAAVLGPGWGFAVLGADIAKGYAATVAGGRLAGDLGANVAGAASVIGHCYPAWNGFRGGKGVATSVGQVLGTFPVYFPLDASVAIATAALPVFKNWAFGATAAASVVWVAATTTWHRKQWSNPGGAGTGVALPVSAVVSSAVIARRFVAEGTRS